MIAGFATEVADDPLVNVQTWRHSGAQWFLIGSDQHHDDPVAYLQLGQLLHPGSELRLDGQLVSVQVLQREQVNDSKRNLNSLSISDSHRVISPVGIEDGVC